MPVTPADWAELKATYDELDDEAVALGLPLISWLAHLGMDYADDHDGGSCDNVNQALDACKPNPCPSEIELLIAKLKAIRARMQ